MKSALFGSLTEYSIFKIVIKIRFLAPAPVCEVCSMQTDFQKTVIMMESMKKKHNIGVTLVSATAIYQTKCPFTVLGALFSSQSALFITKKTCISLNIKTISKQFYSHGCSSLAPQFYIVGGLIIREKSYLSISS